MIKVVLVDMDDTLLDFSEGAKYAMKRACFDAGIQYTEEMHSIFIPYNETLWQRLERGELTKKQLYSLRWTYIFNLLSINGDGLEFEENFRRHISDSAAVINGAEEMLAYLHEKYVVCIASNSSFARVKTRLEKAGLDRFIDHIFTSEQAGATKPNAAFFEYCFNQLPNLKKEEAVIIGDSLSADIKGGIDYGISTVWYNAKKQAFSNEILPKETITSLFQIKNIL